MRENVVIVVNGNPVRIRSGTTIAAAVARAGFRLFRRSVSGDYRAPVCGMGSCFECLVTVDGRPNRRSCRLLCEDGMEVLVEGREP